MRKADSLTSACQKSQTDFFDCASSAKHFAIGKMLLRPKSLFLQAFLWRVIVLPRGKNYPLAPRYP